MEYHPRAPPPPDPVNSIYRTLRAALTKQNPAREPPLVIHTSLRASCALQIVDNGRPGAGLRNSPRVGRSPEIWRRPFPLILRQPTASQPVGQLASHSVGQSASRRFHSGLSRVSRYPPRIHNPICRHLIIYRPTDTPPPPGPLRSRFVDASRPLLCILKE